MSALTHCLYCKFRVRFTISQRECLGLGLLAEFCLFCHCLPHTAQDLGGQRDDMGEVQKNCDLSNTEPSSTHAGDMATLIQT